MTGRSELRRVAPVVDVRHRGTPGTQHGWRRRQFDAIGARPRPVLEGGARRGLGRHGAVDGEPGGTTHLVEEGVLDRLLPGRQHQLQTGAVADIGPHGPGRAVNRFDRGQADRQGDPEDVEVGVVVAGMAVAEDAEGEAAPRLGMDGAVEEGAAGQRFLAGGVGFGAVLEDDRQRVMPGGVLRGAADRGGGLGRLERNRRSVRKRRGLVAMDRGIGVAQKVLRRQRDPPAGKDLPAGRTRPGRDGAVAACQAGEAEAGGILAPHQVVGPAVLAEAQQHGGIGDPLPVVGDGDGERCLAGPGHRNADARGAGPPRILQSLREDVGQGAAIGARDPLDGALVDARADRRRGRIGRRVHAGTSVIGDERKNAPRGEPGGAFCRSCRTASGRGAGTRESPAGRPTRLGRLRIPAPCPHRVRHGR